MGPNRECAIFISHSHEDRELAGTLVDYLVECGFSDDNVVCTSCPGVQLTPGKFDNSLKEHLSSSVAVFVLVTKSSLRSEWVLGEVGAAWALGIEWIIPLLVSGISPNHLKGPLECEYKAIIGSDTQARESMEQAIGDIAQHLGLNLKNNARVSGKLRRFIEQLKTTDAMPPVTEDFCRLNWHFIQRKRQQQNRDQQLILFHTYFNVGENRELAATQSAVNEFFAYRRDINNIYYPVLWSLLGSVEMAVTFRSREVEGDTIQTELSNHIKAQIPPLTSVTMEHFKLLDEYIFCAPVVDNNDHTFVSGRRSPTSPVAEQFRSTYAFIKLKLREHANADKEIQSIHGLLEMATKKHGGDINVDLYAISACKKFVIIELHLPCGRQDSIKKLSKDLKSVLTYWNKDTFIVYEAASLPCSLSTTGGKTLPEMQH